MNPKLSIIIPCYNSEKTLEETLESVLVQDFQEWEAIIINDGSPGNAEEIAKKWINRDSRFKYLKKENGGLASARNLGIKKSIGDYILPLDSDNKIRKTFCKKAIEIFENKENVGVVYGDAKYFGEKTGLWKVGSFDINRLLYSNYIDACAVVRKKVYHSVGFYDDKLPYQGHEDWEFWLKMVSSKIIFFYLEEITFDYRVSEDSMINTFDKKMFNENYEYIRSKYRDLYIHGFNELFEKNKEYKSTIENISFYYVFKKVLKQVFKKFRI